MLLELKCDGFDFQVFEDRFKLVPSGFLKGGRSELTVPISSVTSIGLKRATGWTIGILSWSVAGRPNSLHFKKDNESAEKIVAFIEKRIAGPTRNDRSVEG